MTAVGPVTAAPDPAGRVLTIERAAHQARLTANLVNGSTAAGILVALAARARLGRGPTACLSGPGTGCRSRSRPAFTVGNVVITRMAAGALAAAGPLLAPEARHASQVACCAPAHDPGLLRRHGLVLGAHR
jgi:hypothetical protein